MHKVRWSIEILAVAAMVLALNFFKDAISPALSAQAALSQFTSDVFSQVEVVGYTYMLNIAGILVGLITIAIAAYEVKTYMNETKEKEENEG